MYSTMIQAYLGIASLRQPTDFYTRAKDTWSYLYLPHYSTEVLWVPVLTGKLSLQWPSLPS
jgi:hypothetical protein